MQVKSTFLQLAYIGILSLSVVVSDDVATPLCTPNSGSRKLQCSDASKLVQYSTRGAEVFDSVVKLIQRPGDVKVLWLSGVRFSNGLITSRTFEKFTSLANLVCTNCSLIGIEKNAFRMQTETLTQLELNGNKNLEDFGEQSLPALQLLKISGCKLSKFPNVGDTSTLREIFLDGSSTLKELNGEELSTYKYLERLSLSGLKQLKSIEKARMAKLPKSLRRLAITGSAIESIEAGAFESLQALDTLNLGYNLLDALAVTNALTGLTSIKQLSVAGSSKLNKLPSSTFDPIRGRVEEIDVSRCPLDTLEDDLFAGMPLLRNLKLNCLRINAVKKSVFNRSESLSHLDLSNNSLQIERVDLTQLPSLTYLDVSNNKYMFDSGTFGMAKFGTLTSLQTLRLRNCSIARIDNLEKLRGLKEVDLSYNELESVPPAICTDLPNFISIKTLDLSYQKGRFQLPSTACTSLRELGTLKLSGLNIDTQALLDASAFWKGMEATITDLDLSDNQLQTLLESTDKKESNFAKFLAFFSTSKKINTLSMQRSSIDGVIELASVCLAVPNIRVLSLNGNRIKAVRSSESTMRTCPSLTLLGLKDNQLSTLESSTMTQLCSMPSVNQVDLLGNSFDCSCELAGFWYSFTLSAYALGSQRWAFIGSIWKPKTTQTCKLNGIDVSLIGYGETQCDLKKTVDTWRPCAETKKNNALRNFKSQLASGGMTDIPDDEFLASYEPRSDTSNGPSYTGAVIGCVAVVGTLATAGVILYKRRSGKWKKVAGTRYNNRRGHKMRILGSSNSSQETLSVDESRVQSTFPPAFDSLPEVVINPGRSAPQPVTLHNPASSLPPAVAEVHMQPQLTANTNHTDSQVLIPPGKPAKSQKLVDIDLSDDIAENNTHIKVPDDSSAPEEDDDDECIKQTNGNSAKCDEDDFFK